MLTIEKILIDLERATSFDIAQYFKITEDSKRGFIDFIGERYKSYLSSSDLNLPTVQEEQSTATTDQTLSEKIWSYRLYSYPSADDKFVRKGDIIKKDEKYYLVISANCDLTRFWKKNLGYLNCVPLYSFKDHKVDIKSKYSTTQKPDDAQAKMKPGSMLSKLGEVEGPFILPFIKIQDKDESEYFFAFPKEITSLKITPTENISKKDLKKLPLKDEHITNYQRICCLNEPFLTQVVENIYCTLRGFGVPDYDDVTQDTIRIKAEEIFKKDV